MSHYEGPDPSGFGAVVLLLFAAGTVGFVIGLVVFAVVRG